MAVLTDGFPTFVNFQVIQGVVLNGVAGVLYKEHTVTPPGLDSNGPNDTTNMRNKQFRTKQPKKLVTMTEFKMSVFYDTVIYDTTSVFWQVLRNLCLSFVSFPDGSGMAFWGWLDKLNPQDIKEGESPSAEASIQCGNQAFCLAGTVAPGTAVTTPAAGKADVLYTTLTEMLPKYFAVGTLAANAAGGAAAFA